MQIKAIRYSQEKDEWLRVNRKISFEKIIEAVQKNRVLAILEHPNKKRFLNQQLLIVNINNYAYVVPYIETDTELFLKTIFPSRKYTKKYIKKEDNCD